MQNRINLIAEIGVNHNGKINLAKKMIVLGRKQNVILLSFNYLRQKIW